MGLKSALKSCFGFRKNKIEPVGVDVAQGATSDAATNPEAPQERPGRYIIQAAFAIETRYPNTINQIKDDIKAAVSARAQYIDSVDVVHVSTVSSSKLMDTWRFAIKNANKTPSQVKLAQKLATQSNVSPADTCSEAFLASGLSVERPWTFTGGKDNIDIAVSPLGPRCLSQSEQGTSRDVPLAVLGDDDTNEIDSSSWSDEESSQTSPMRAHSAPAILMSLDDEDLRFIETHRCIPYFDRQTLGPHADKRFDDLKCPIGPVKIY